MALDINKDVRSNIKYAQIFQFFNNFGELIDIKPNFEEFESILTGKDNDGISVELLELQAKLLRRAFDNYRYTNKSNVVIERFIEEHTELQNLDGYKDYFDIPLDLKMELFLEICDLAAVNVKNIQLGMRLGKMGRWEMRWKPLGKDYDQTEYYYQEDRDLNIRIYTNSTVNNKNVWSLKTKTTQGLYKLINQLKGAEPIDESISVAELPELYMSRADKKFYVLFDKEYSYIGVPRQIVEKPKPTKDKKRKSNIKGKGDNTQKPVEGEVKEQKAKEPKKVEEKANRVILKAVKLSATQNKEANLMSSWLNRIPTEAKFNCKKCNEKGDATSLNVCKTCDVRYHFACVNRATKSRMWNCPKCTNKDLVGRLTMVYIRLNELKEKKRQQLLEKNNIVVKSGYSLRKYQALEKLEQALIDEGSDVESEEEVDSSYHEDNDGEEEEGDNEEDGDENEEPSDSEDDNI
ncbi:unnamed protein product [Bursaphelenchus okinawaensis]|uniref:DDT domain-containing protein n=1 Tax=Bursaphelenchus okinawaensis TaxID=465554 RepID=A0A811L938_9BILA|nr:unnamed protein product [Bursaphelenchus okinawaensis]CAG9118415.1 unnamed protein product [Bursaphelenchus okinawaensis]